MATDENLYDGYKPSKPAAIAACVIFIILTLSQAWRVYRTRRWFGLTIIIGGLFEVIGLASRAQSREDVSAKGPYIMQSLLILLAPIWFAASIYMFLGRLILASGYCHLSLIRTNWLSKIFVTGDVICFLVAGAGAGMLVNAESKSSQTNGKNIVLGGLGLQVVIFLVFVVCAVVFHVRIVSKDLLKTINPKLELVPMMAVLYICSVLVMFRNIFRLIEYEQGKDGYLQSHEWPAYVLDVFFMAIIMFLTLGWYGADLKNEKNSYTLQALPVSSESV
ncbi:hypothetical protein FSARC_2992 [Fusarium sarcochroum]|uniref:Uncharacterized protein n=1 Tax=Fusarium sarcochroum TaxID=1208366 RepID=A0A8H4U5D2_9HYPO|nr:hypothetical protein FSARC_2992 [Fusarium sarcochroum]